MIVKVRDLTDAHIGRRLQGGWIVVALGDSRHHWNGRAIILEPETGGVPVVHDLAPDDELCFAPLDAVVADAVDILGMTG